MNKIDRRNASLAYNARAVAEWRAKGYSEASINHMVICSLECTRSVHADPAADAVIVLEIANGQRAA